MGSCVRTSCVTTSRNVGTSVVFRLLYRAEIRHSYPNEIDSFSCFLPSTRTFTNWRATQTPVIPYANFPLTQIVMPGST